MIDIPRVEPDIHGTNSVNTILNEKVMLTDKNLSWIVPNGAPFFGEQPLFKLYNAAGGELLLERDYYFEEEFQPLCKLTGRRICCFIRLETTILESNDFVTINYQSVGLEYVPRNDLDEWIKEATGGKPIPFSKVVGVPDTVPASLHVHDIKTEIGDWYEVTDFLKLLAAMQNAVDPTLNTQVDVLIDSSIPTAKSTRDTRMNTLVAHDKNYNNPHSTNKAHLNLGNVDNYHTATVAEDQAGVRSDLFSTPAGVIQAAKANIPNSDSLMLQGLMPISRYAGDNYIPPAISGSFEGMGNTTDVSGVCLERNKELMILSNHMDGRVNGLYYSVVKNYNDPAKITHLYTQHQYDPPVLRAIGVTPNRIISGSGNKVIMVGVANTSDWYIALSNGTFDPGYHSYVKCDMSAVEANFGSPYREDTHAVIHHMEEYLVLVQSATDHPDDTGTILYQRFYRVKTDDVRNNRPVAWEPIKVSYEDVDGNTFTDVYKFSPVTKVKGPDAYHIASYGSWTFPSPPRWDNNPPRVISVSNKKAGEPGIFNYRMVHRVGFAYDEPPVYRAGWGMHEVLYEFNPTTGAMVLKQKPGPDTLDFAGPESEMTRLLATLPYFVSMTSTIYSAGSVVLLETGEMVMAFAETLVRKFPVMVYTLKFAGADTVDAVITSGLNLAVHPAQYYVQLSPVVQPPILSGTYPGGVVYEPDGEIYDAINQTTGNREMYFRQVSGDYAIHPEVFNLNLGNIYSRPLSNDVFSTNLAITDGLIGITGTATELTAGGAEEGSTSLSMCAWASNNPLAYVPANTAFRAPSSGNVLVSFPRTYTKTVDPTLKKATYAPTSFYGLRQTIIDKLKGFIPPEYASAPSPWSFTIYVLGSENEGMFNGINMALISVNFLIDAREFRTQLISANLTIDPPGGDHPGVYLISDFTPLSTPAHVRSSPAAASTDGDTFYRFYTLNKRPKLLAYRDNGKLKVSLCPGFYVWTSAGNTHFEAIFDLTISTGAIANIASGGFDWGDYQGDGVVMLPRIGMTDINMVINDPNNTNLTPVFYQNEDSGGAASIYKKGTNYYLTASGYPAVGWIFTIPDRVAVVFNGVGYVVQGGSIDLRDVAQDPANKTFYLYITVEDTVPKYVLSMERLRKTLVMMRVATLTTNDKQIITIEREQPTMLADYLISYNREGGIIPVSAGFPQDEGDFIFFHDAELL